MTKRSKTSAFERVAASAPVDRTAALVAGKGYRYVPDKQILTADRGAPHPMMPFPGGPRDDLTGTRRGRLTVVGYWSGRPSKSKAKGALWVARCVCGTYTLRHTKSLKNPANHDACEECRHADHLRRQDRWRSKRGDPEVPT